MIIENVKQMLYPVGPKETIGVTSGCFDLLHVLHIEYINRCRKQCDRLFVLLDADRLMYENKKKTPVINQNDRATCIDNLKSVDGVMLIEQISDIKSILSGIYNSRPYASNRVVCFKNSIRIYGANLIEVPGVENIIIPDINRFHSTTEIINHIKTTHEIQSIEGHEAV